MNTTTPSGADALQEVLKFLLGEETLDGAYFGEVPKGCAPYWWRKPLRAALSAAQEAPSTWSNTKQAELNDWFLSLPEGRQKALIEDKWMLAGAAFEAGKARATQEAPAAQEPSADALDVKRYLWMPIDTAPKDEAVLLYGAKRLEMCVGMNHSRDGWVTDTTSEWASMYPPTHWMPLPHKPKD